MVSTAETPKLGGPVRHYRNERSRRHVQPREPARRDPESPACKVHLRSCALHLGVVLIAGAIFDFQLLRRQCVRAKVIATFCLYDRAVLNGGKEFSLGYKHP